MYLLSPSYKIAQGGPLSGKPQHKEALCWSFIVSVYLFTDILAPVRKLKQQSLLCYELAMTSEASFPPHTSFCEYMNNIIRMQ